jgi:hypothetical protein
MRRSTRERKPREFFQPAPGIPEETTGSSDESAASGDEDGGNKKTSRRVRNGAQKQNAKVLTCLHS